jgi:hypothetical protein
MSAWIELHPVVFALVALPTAHVLAYAVVVAIDVAYVRFRKGTGPA